MSDPPRLSAGRVGRPHGLDGSFYVTRPRPQMLALGASVEVEGDAREIVRRSGTDQRPILRLGGIEDRESALGLRGAELTVAVGDVPALGPDEYWAHELEGCEVTAGGRPIGVVSRMLELPSCEALEVAPAAGGAPLLVPMVKDAIRDVRIDQRRIEVSPQFLDLPAQPDDGGEDR